MFAELLQLADQHARVVIAGLFATLVVGSVGGGFWIYNLQSLLDEKNNLADQRIAIVEGRLENRLESTEKRNQVLRAQLTILESGFARMSGAVKEIASIMKRETSRSNSYQNQRNLVSRVESLEQETRSLDEVVRRARDLDAIASQSPFPTANVEPLRSPLKLINFLPILLLTFVVMLGVIIFRQQRELKSREHELLVLKSTHSNEGDGSMPDF